MNPREQFRLAYRSSRKGEDCMDQVLMQSGERVACIDWFGCRWAARPSGQRGSPDSDSAARRTAEVADGFYLLTYAGNLRRLPEFQNRERRWTIRPPRELIDKAREAPAPRLP